MDKNMRTWVGMENTWNHVCITMLVRSQLYFRLGLTQDRMESYDAMKVTEGSKVIGQAIKSSRIFLCLVATIR